MVYGNESISKLFPRGMKRLGEFKRFFCLYDPRSDLTSNKSKYNLFKVSLFLSHILCNFKKYWVVGCDVRIDE